MASVPTRRIPIPGNAPSNAAYLPRAPRPRCRHPRRRLFIRHRATGRRPLHPLQCPTIAPPVVSNGSRPIATYQARLSARDHRSSSGASLDSIPDILRQDRANFHRFNARDPRTKATRSSADMRQRAPLRQPDVLRRHREVIVQRHAAGASRCVPAPGDRDHSLAMKHLGCGLPSCSCSLPPATGACSPPTSRQFPQARARCSPPTPNISPASATERFSGATARAMAFDDGRTGKTRAELFDGPR